MNRFKLWVMAAALICSSTVFTSCSNDDNPATPDLNLSEKIIGKWMPADKDGQPMPTNKKMVIDFVSPIKAIMSASLSSHPEAGTFWGVSLEGDVAINDNKVTVTSQPDEHTTLVHEFIITDINDKEFKGNHEVTYTIDDNVVLSIVDEVRYVKQTADYSEAILGTWEGHVTNSEGSVYDDGETHRWEYKADGTYKYYSQNEEGEWVPSDNDLNEYFVDGILLATRWIDNDEEFREWWEIASIKDGVMKWKALRQKEDGSTYTATFEMKKVE